MATIVVSQVGMSASSPPDKEYTFQEQIDHKVFCFDMLQKANPDARIIIMGHSIGAYLAAEVVKQRPTAVSRVFGLFPCLYDIGKTPKGIRIQVHIHTNTQLRIHPMLNGKGNSAIC